MLNILERDSFTLGLFLTIVMLIFLKDLVAAVTLVAFLGLTINTAITIVCNCFLLYIIPCLMMKWAPLVDGDIK